MPTYDYECQACGHKFEHFGKIHDTTRQACPNCGKKRTKRLIGAGAGFIFKGSGFYVTDSRGPANGATAKSDAKPALKGSEAHPSGPAASPTAESKPRKKSE